MARSEMTGHLFLFKSGINSVLKISVASFSRLTTSQIDRRAWGVWRLR